MEAKKKTEEVEHFRVFAKSLQATNERKYGKIPSGRQEYLDFQGKQVEKLVRLEKKFVRAIIKSPYGSSTYQKFVKYICDIRKNILDARPFFRERQTVFTAEISGSLKRRDYKNLQKFRINWQFVTFVLNSRHWAEESDVVKIAKEIKDIRTELIEMNLPLAISRARIFWSCTPKCHLNHMDLIQIACEGLMSGVDKFVLPFSSRFRAVCIGRIIGNFIEGVSETLIHFYPVDKRKIYRGNKASSRCVEKFTDLDFEALAEKVNLGVEDSQHLTTSSEISGLMCASRCVSASDIDATKNSQTTISNKNTDGISRYAAPDSCRPDMQVEHLEAFGAIAKLFPKMPLKEQKLIRLMGVDFTL